MTVNVKLTWKVFNRLPEAASDYVSGESTELFDVRTGKKILREVGGSIQSSFFPLVLEPKSPLFAKLLATAHHHGLAGSKMSFQGSVPSDFVPTKTALDCRFGIHVYGKHVCITVECEPFAVAEDIDLSKVQDLAFFPGLKAMVKRLMELLTSKGNRVLPVPGDFKVYPCMQLAAIPGTKPLSSTELAAIVTRHPKINNAATESVVAKNLDHQIDGTTTLVDRQGVLCYVPPTAHADETAGSDRRFRSCAAMIELAAAAQRVMHDQINIPTPVIESLASLIFNTRATIPNSTSAQRAWALFASEFSLAEGYKNVSQREPKVTTAMPPLAVVASDPTVGNRAFKNSTDPEMRVLCLAAATIELSTVAARLQETYGEGEMLPLDGGQEYALQYRDSENSVTWYVVPLSFQGQVDAAVSIRTLCNLLKPTLALMVGMCMSMPGKGLPVGTVVIPNEVMVFDHVRQTTEGIQHRPHGDRVDNGLFKLARLMASSRKFDFKVVTDKGLASATSKIENIKSELVQFIGKAFPDATAFDMEGWGFYRAGAGQLCLWIKAVADTGEPQGTSHADQQIKQTTQAEVTNNAINFALVLVETFIKANKKQFNLLVN